jgi:putative tryptophan/tyrosine transport system substrate-binding protein
MKSLPDSGATMRRREFIGFVGWTAATWAFAAHAQRGEGRKRIGVLIGRPQNDAEGQSYVAAFQKALEQLGWRSGDNVVIDYRWMAGDANLADTLAKELVALRPDILVINATVGVLAARRTAGTIPIVMVAVADPVAQGFVQSLERPGGTITGFAVEEPAMGAKWVELLKEIAPRVKHITAVCNLDSSPFAKLLLPSMEDVQASLSFELAVSPVRNDNDVERAITTAGSQQEAGLVFLPDSFLGSRREMIANLVAKQKIPAIYPSSAFVRSGGLIGYGFDRADIFRRSAGYVDRVLKGEKPDHLPVQMPTKFELAINLKTAKALGLFISPTLLARADEVVE